MQNKIIKAEGLVVGVSTNFNENEKKEIVVVTLDSWIVPFVNYREDIEGELPRSGDRVRLNYYVTTKGADKVFYNVVFIKVLSGKVPYYMRRDALRMAIDSFAYCGSEEVVLRRADRFINWLSDK